MRIKIERGDGIKRLTKMNHITYQAFRIGLIEELGYNIAKLSLERQHEIIREVEEKWWFCGGKDTKADSDHYSHSHSGEAGMIDDDMIGRWVKLWWETFPNRPMPESVEKCICKQQRLRYNCYITDGTKVIIIGSVCMEQFLPKQYVEAKEASKKHCANCSVAHRNRKDNYCKKCRPIMKERQKRDEEDRKLREHEERLLREHEERIEEQKRLEFMIGWLKRSPMIHDKIIAKRMKEQQKREAKAEQQRQVFEAERERQKEEKKEQDRAEWERQRVLHTCECGEWKKPEFPRCWNCRVKYIAGMTEAQKKVLLCPCGKTKKPQFATCWGCRS